ncbi:hypothetical protein [Terasakiella sp. SH-1]|uniref:hypothetical protein n=1 Tax=Terasakiella sp. SH-1 TaxID=2560057 RepID=UPI00143116E7|nr:hypothetical protein [Terasakiella sp. SH-1]
MDRTQRQRRLAAGDEKGFEAVEEAEEHLTAVQYSNSLPFTERLCGFVLSKHQASYAN